MPPPPRCPQCGAEPYDDHARNCPDARRRERPLTRTPLQRHTPLRARTPLRSKTPWQPERTPLRHRSAKTARTYVARRALVARLLEERRLCEARWDDNCQIVAHDIHEILPRSQGGRIVGGRPVEYLAVCRLCHGQIETHPQEAHARGFRRWSWEGNPE